MSLLAGAAEVDITPPLGTHLSGDLCRHRPADRVLDPIYARALVLENDQGVRLCYLVLDLCVADNDWADAIRDRIGRQLGVPRAAVMLHLTQNHSAPGVGELLFRKDSPLLRPQYWWLVGSDPTYPAFLEPRMLAAVTQAAAKLEPVTLRHGNGVDGRIAFNRRFIKRDGTVQTIPRPADLPDILQVEGPTDPEVAVVTLHNAAGRTIAALLHHTAHPVSFFGTNHITASWPGRWCDLFRRRAGGDCIALMVNGCCGNINASNPLDPEHVSDDDTIARRLMQTTEQALELAQVSPGPEPLAFASQTLPLARAQFDAQEVARARALIDQHPEPLWLDPATRRHVDPNWTFALLLLDLDDNYRQNPIYPYEVQVFRVGDLALVGLKGEPFVEGQLQIKLHSPTRRTLVAHQCNGYLGYLPHRAGAERFNYNYYAADGTPVRRGATRLVLEIAAMEKVLAGADRLLGQLWPAATVAGGAGLK